MRDKAILKSFKREINLRTKVVQDKKQYTRKQKHKTPKHLLKNPDGFLSAI